MKPVTKALIVSGLLFWLVILILIFGKAFSQSPCLFHIPHSHQTAPAKQPYKITGTKAAGWIVTAIGAFADGAVEGYEFDGRKSFERKWDADPHGFWGSESWRLAYQNGNPDEGYKNILTENFGAMDFYHVADDVRKVGYITGSVTVGIGAKKSNSKWWHYALDVGASLAISAAAKRAGMAWVRN